jgi:hypothetical protein
MPSGPRRIGQEACVAILRCKIATSGIGMILMLRLSVWCIGGMLVSFVTDFLSPEGLQGTFCVGRCLC